LAEKVRQNENIVDHIEMAEQKEKYNGK